MSVESRTGEKRNELLADLVQQVERTLVAHGVSPALASIAANATADHMTQHWRGQQIYMPADYHWKLTQRELEIYDAFTGANHLELCRRHGITDSGLRRMLERIKAKMKAARHERQLDMLEPPEPGRT